MIFKKKKKQYPPGPPRTRERKVTVNKGVCPKEKGKFLIWKRGKKKKSDTTGKRGQCASRKAH